MPKNKSRDKILTLQAEKLNLVSGGSSVRKIALKHLRNLLAAAGTATTVMSCRCGSVDPLPPPFRCIENMTTGDFLDVYGKIYFHAALLNEGENVIIRVNVEVLQVGRPKDGGILEDGDPIKFTSDPVVIGSGTISNLHREDEKLTFDISLQSGVKQIDIDIPLDCNGLNEGLFLRLDISKDPISVTYRDS